MSLTRFVALEEEHGELDQSSRDAQEHNMRSRFLLFYLVVGVAHVVLTVYAIIYAVTASSSSNVPAAVCFANTTEWADMYKGLFPKANVTIPNTGSYTCGPIQNDSSLYISLSVLGGVLVLVGYVCHRQLPPNTAWLKYLDAVLVVVTYIVNVAGTMLMTYNGGSVLVYKLPSMMGARVAFGVSSFMSLWKHTVATLPWPNLYFFLVPQVLFLLADLVFVIPAIAIIFDMNFFWFLLLDVLACGILGHTASRRHDFEEKSMALHAKHVRLQALKFGAVHTEIVSILKEEFSLTSDEVALRKFPWRLDDSAVSIDSTIGKGSQAEVFKGSYQGAVVAFKVPVAEACSEMLNSLAMEAATLWSLQKHPFLLTFYGLVRTTSHFGVRTSMVFEWCPQTLEMALESGWKTTPGSVLPHQAQVLRQIASAVACLHHADIQHRDLKPDNVFFGRDGDVRVADFGISNKSTAQIKGGRLDGDTGGFNSVEMLGTPGYIVPVLLCVRNGEDVPAESLRDDGTFDFTKHDAFAYVVMAIEVLTGMGPYGQDATGEGLLDPTFVTRKVEASLSSDDIEPAWRQQLLDFYFSATSPSGEVNFVAFRDCLALLNPNTCKINRCTVPGDSQPAFGLGMDGLEMTPKTRREMASITNAR